MPAGTYDRTGESTLKDPDPGAPTAAEPQPDGNIELQPNILSIHRSSGENQELDAPSGEEEGLHKRRGRRASYSEIVSAKNRPGKFGTS